MRTANSLRPTRSNRRRRLLVALVAGSSAVVALTGIAAPANASQLGSPSGGNAVELALGSAAVFSYTFSAPGNHDPGLISVNGLTATYSYTCGTDTAPTAPVNTLTVPFAPAQYSVDGSHAVTAETSQVITADCGTQLIHVLPQAIFTGSFGSNISIHHLNVVFTIQGTRSSTNIAHVGAFQPVLTVTDLSID